MSYDFSQQVLPCHEADIDDEFLVTSTEFNGTAVLFVESNFADVVPTNRVGVPKIFLRDAALIGCYRSADGHPQTQERHRRQCNKRNPASHCGQIVGNFYSDDGGEQTTCDGNS